MFLLTLSHTDVLAKDISDVHVQVKMIFTGYILFVVQDVLPCFLLQYFV